MGFRMLLIIASVASVMSFTFAPIAIAQQDPGKLLEGPMPAAIDALNAQLKQNPNDDQRRFALGMAQSLHAVETLSASLYAHGVRGPKGVAEELPIFNIPVPENPNPKETTIDDVDAMIAQFVTDLQAAQKTLAMVHDPNVKLPVRVGMIQLDLNGDAPGGETHLWEIGAMTELQTTKEQADTFEIHFDLGDALAGRVHASSVRDRQSLPGLRQARVVRRNRARLLRKAQIGQRGIGRFSEGLGHGWNQRRRSDRVHSSAASAGQGPGAADGGAGRFTRDDRRQPGIVGGDSEGNRRRSRMAAESEPDEHGFEPEGHQGNRRSVDGVSG